MNDRYDDPSIPTLTQRVTPTHEPPLLTERASTSPPWDVEPVRVVAQAQNQPSNAVLHAVLQADIEDAVQHALDEALQLVKVRLEAQLPEIVANAIRRTRAG